MILRPIQPGGIRPALQLCLSLLFILTGLSACQPVTGRRTPIPGQGPAIPGPETTRTPLPPTRAPATATDADPISGPTQDPAQDRGSSATTTAIPDPAPPPERDDFIRYQSRQAQLGVRFPRDWIFVDLDTLRIGSHEEVVNNPGFRAGSALILIIGDAHRTLPLAEVGAGTSPAEMIMLYLETGGLAPYGTDLSLVRAPIASTRNGRPAASATVSVTTATGQRGLIDLTVMVMPGLAADSSLLDMPARVTLILGLTLVVDAPQFLRTLRSVAGSVDLTEGSDIALAASQPVLIRAGESIRDFWRDPAPAYRLPVTGDNPLLVVLQSRGNSDGRFVVLNETGRREAVVDRTGVGQVEAELLEPRATGEWTLELIENHGSSGTFLLHILDLRPGSTTLIDFAEATLARAGVVELSYGATAGESLLIYVRPVGPNAARLDPVLEVVSPAVNQLLFRDDGYLGEAELAQFEAMQDGVHTIRVTDFFSLAGAVAIYVLRAPRDA